MALSRTQRPAWSQGPRSATQRACPLDCTVLVLWLCVLQHAVLQHAVLQHAHSQRNTISGDLRISRVAAHELVVSYVHCAHIGMCGSQAAHHHQSDAIHAESCSVWKRRQSRRCWQARSASRSSSEDSAGGRRDLSPPRLPLSQSQAVLAWLTGVSCALVRWCVGHAFHGRSRCAKSSPLRVAQPTTCGAGHDVWCYTYHACYVRIIWNEYCT